MNFYPCNRHILLDKATKEEKKGEPMVLLPEGYTPSVEEFASYIVVRSSPDCTIDVCAGEIVLVESSMVKEIKFEDEIYTLILENYVFGFFGDERGDWQY